MKVVMGRAPGDVRIYTDAGEDITSDLCVAEISIFATAEGSTVTLTCEQWELQGEFDYDTVAAQVRVMTSRSV